MTAERPLPPLRTCRPRCCAIPFQEIQDGDHVYCTLLNFEAYPGICVFENVSNKSENYLLTLITTVLLCVHLLRPHLFLDFM